MKHLPKLALALPALLTGCIVLTKSHIENDMARSFYTYAGPNADFRTVVVGNPFTDDQAKVDAVITGALNKGFDYLHTNFTTTPNDTERKPYKMVVVFDPPVVNSADICADPSAGKGGKAGEKLRVQMIFCEKEPMQEVTAELPRTASLAGSELQDALYSMIRDLHNQMDERERAASEGSDFVVVP